MASSTKVSGEYASGIDLPFRSDSDGGIALSEGDTYIQSQVLATVSPNESDNPFQDIGGTDLPIFQNADDIDWKVATKDRITRQFQALEDENLARLETVEFMRGKESGSLEVKIAYINLESTTSAEVTAEITSTGSVGVAVQSGGFA